MFEDEPLPFPETKEAVVKYITERRVYDPLAHDRFKPKEAELKRTSAPFVDSANAWLTLLLFPAQ